MEFKKGSMRRRDGWVVESGWLLIRCTSSIRTEGSNPSLSENMNSPPIYICSACQRRRKFLQSERRRSSFAWVWGLFCCFFKKASSTSASLPTAWLRSLPTVCMAWQEVGKAKKPPLPTDPKPWQCRPNNPGVCYTESSTEGIAVWMTQQSFFSALLKSAFH